MAIYKFNFRWNEYLYAVQFGNNWMEKFLRTAKIGGFAMAFRGIFESNYFQNWRAYSPLTY